MGSWNYMFEILMTKVSLQLNYEMLNTYIMNTGTDLSYSPSTAVKRPHEQDTLIKESI